MRKQSSTEAQAAEALEMATGAPPSATEVCNTPGHEPYHPYPIPSQVRQAAAAPAPDPTSTTAPTPPGRALRPKTRGTPAP